MNSPSLEVLQSLLASLRSCWDMEKTFSPPKYTNRSHHVLLNSARSSWATLFSDLHSVLQEINEIGSQVISHVGYRRNTLSPINMLPVELLGKIFMEATGCDAIQTEEVSRTCVHWRKVALSHHALWTHFVFDGEPDELWTQLTMTSRSNDLPLSVRINIALDLRVLEKTSTILFWLERYYHRVQELDYYDKYRTRLVGNFLRTSGAPSLKRLRWDMSDRPNLFYTPSPRGGNPPPLTSLCFVGCRIQPWTSSCYKGLTTLELQFDENERSDGIEPLNSILPVLQACPDLEVFSLQCEYPSLLEDATKTMLPLKHLRKLHLNLPPHVTVWLLSQISAFPLVELSCAYKDFELLENATHPQKILSTNPQWKHLIDSIDTLSVNISISPAGGGSSWFASFSFEGLIKSSIAPSLPPRRVSLQFKHKLYYTCVQEGVVKLLSDVATVLVPTYSFPKLSTCNISFEGYYMPDEEDLLDPFILSQDPKMAEHIATLLKIIPTIDTMKLSHFPAPDQWGGLIKACQSSSPSFLPHLRSLIVENIGIYPESSGGRSGLLQFTEAWEQSSPTPPDSDGHRLDVSAVRCWYAKEDPFKDDNLWMSSSLKAIFDRIANE